MDAKGASGSWIVAVVATPRTFGSCNDRPGLRRSPLRASAQPLGLLSPNCLRSGLSVDSPLPRWSDGLRARGEITPTWHKHGLVVPQRDLMRAPVGVGRFPCLPLQQHRPWKNQYWAISTVYDWRVHGKGPTDYRFGKHLKFAITDVRAWIAEQREPSSPPRRTDRR